MDNKIKNEMVELLNWLTSSESPYAVLYGNKERFCDFDREYTIEEMIEIYLLNKEITTAEAFNEKYKYFLEEGHYGLALSDPRAIQYLDKKFQEFIKRPDFKFSQIKAKFNSFCFYADGITIEEQNEVEKALKDIYSI